MTQLSIIILSYNTAKLTENCISSLVTHYADALKNKEIEILVVDNNSSDDSVAELKKSAIFPYIHLIENQHNDGFGKGINLGVSHAKGEYLLFLNSDTTVEDTGLVNMGDYLRKNEHIGILGGRLKNADGSPQASAGVFYTVGRVFLLLIGAERFGHLRFSPQKQTSVDWVSGALMMTKKEFFEKLGGFDENIFMYMEDMEFCYRVKKMGKEVVFYPACSVTHVSHASSNRSFAIVQIYKGIVYFYRKHKSALAYAVVKTLLLTKAYVLIVFGALLGKSYLKETYSKAIQAI